ncbi:MAG: carboxypeptidase-like regulatory domain-containing protein [Balneolaceae bacterium]
MLNSKLKSLLTILFATTFLFTISQGLVNAQTVNFENTEITGEVYDASTGEILADVEIIIAETGDVAVSDAGGNFSFQLEETGSYTINVSHEGFETFTTTVNVTEEGASVVIELDPED